MERMLCLGLGGRLSCSKRVLRENSRRGRHMPTTCMLLSLLPQPWAWEYLERLWCFSSRVVGLVSGSAALGLTGSGD